MTHLPFDVDGSQVEHLGPAFTGFVNRLLDSERGMLGLSGDSLHITSKEETPDGGVDAVLVSPRATEWVPTGESAWQFKRSDFTPTKCTEELEGASFARDLLKRGASYVLALGARLSTRQIKNRREALVSTAVDLVGNEETARARVKVYDGNMLARWGSRYPSVLTYPALNANLGPVVSFERWSASRTHQTTWTPDDHRGELTEKLRRVLKGSSGPVSVRIEGVSGMGKTRFALESLRDEELSPLVVYARQAQDLVGTTINYLLDRERQAVIVVDECDARTHEKLEEALPYDSNLRLITIGESGDRPLRSPTYDPGLMASETIQELLKRDFAALSQEAIRFVGERCEGNVRFAIVLAERLVQQTAADAAELIRRGDVEGILRIALPEGAPFLVASALALFRRVGWEEEKETQLESLARFLGSTISEVKAQAHLLAHAGLLVSQGRYRAVAPDALAVLLASEVWRLRSNEVVRELVPTLDREMLQELLGRAAELGRYEPSRLALENLLNPKGPFGTLDQIEEQQLSHFLIDLSIVSPSRTLSHLARILGEIPIPELVKYTKSRRDTVWALEKLAWHSSTFVEAADLLLRLALAENETFANNATGTWVALFKAALPATAASPEARLRYLSEKARDDDQNVRALVVSAASSALDFHETAMVSAEVQAGAVVEPRGGVKTRQELQEYHAELIRILASSATDEEAAVRDVAVDDLISHAPQYLGEELADLYGSVLRELPERSLAKLRQAIQRWRRDYERREDEALLNAIDALDAVVASEDPLERLQVLASIPPWGIDEAKLLAEISPLLQRVRDQGRENDLFDWASEESLDAGWFVGLAIAESWPEVGIEGSLLPTIEKNSAFVAGFLTRRVREGDSAAFDEFDSRYGDKLSPMQRLDLAVRGPHTGASHERVLSLISGPNRIQSVAALYVLTPWIREIGAGDVRTIIRSWMNPAPDGPTYEALVDLIHHYLFKREAQFEEFQDEIWILLEGRRNFPKMGRSRWDWGRLAALVLPLSPERLARLILDLIGNPEEHLVVLEDDQEAALLRQAAHHAPAAVWAEVGTRLDSGNWRISLTLRGWGAEGFPVDLIAEWVGTSKDRAVAVANIAKAGDEQPTPLANWLLDTHGDVPEISSALAAEFMSGTWVGSWSSRVTTQIAQMKQWRSVGSLAVRRWADEMMESLEHDLEVALRREAEERW